ncbi:hypothetical protein [Persephonella sp.]
MIYPQITGLLTGYSLTVIFLLSLSFLYYIDSKYKTKDLSVYIFYIFSGSLALMLFLLFLIFLGKSIIYFLSPEFSRDVAFSYLVLGIIWGAVTFPFIVRGIHRLKRSEINRFQ